MFYSRCMYVYYTSLGTMLAQSFSLLVRVTNRMKVFLWYSLIPLAITNHGSFTAS